MATALLTGISCGCSEDKHLSSFGMLMPARHGYSSQGGWASGSSSTGGNTVPADITLDGRYNNEPSQYKASHQIEFIPGFGSSDGDSFETFITDGNTSGNGSSNGNGVASGSYRYGFNGKENDNDVKGEGNEQDYGMRIYDPRLGRFLSVDPLTNNFCFYSPYHYSGNSPIRFIDLDGAETYDNSSKFWANQPLIDISKAPAKGVNAAGVPRNAIWFFKQQLSAKPEMFSEANKFRINNLGNNPIVDETWVKFNPAAADYMGQKLIHHHINGGEIVAGIPERMHYDNFSELHPYINSGKALRGTKISGGLSGLMSVISNATLITGVLTGDPENWVNAFGAMKDPEAYVDKRVFKDWESGLYFEITKVTVSVENTRNNKGEILKSRVYKREVSADVFSDYIWDDNLKRYKGVNKTGSQSETWLYDKDNNRTVEPKKTNLPL